MTSKVTQAELHCHIEGAVPVSLAKKQADKYGVDITAILGADSYKWHDFTTFLYAYDTIAGLFRTDDDYANLAEAYFTQLANDGAIYGEIFVSPDHARAAGLEPEQYIEALAEGMARAEEKCGIVSRMCIVGIRHLGAHAVANAAKLASAHIHPWVTGFGMAGDERYGHLKDFAPAFDHARAAGLNITVHAGELCGYQSVLDALEFIKPARIGHGVRAIEDRKTLDLLVENNTVLEVCPGSNVALNVFDSWDAHPFDRLKEHGVKLTISSDDPPHFNTSLSNDYAMIAKTFGYSRQDMLEFTKNAINAAFVDEPTRQKLLAKLS